MSTTSYNHADAAMQSFNTLHANYDMAQQNRFQRRRTGVSSVGHNADFHYRNEADYLRMTEIARDINRNDPIVKQGIRRLIDNVVRNGFKINPQTGNKDADKLLKRKFEKWCGNRSQCHAAKKFTFREIERLGLEHIVVDGDAICLPLKTGQLETIENHRLRTPRRTQRNVVHGVRLNEMGAATEYWLTKKDHGFYQSVERVGDVKRYPAFKGETPLVYHLYSTSRFTQTRGVTAIAPIANIAGMLDDVQFAKLVQQQVASCYAIIKERDINYEGNGAANANRETDAYGKPIVDYRPGMEYQGEVGEKIKGFAPDIPGPSFFDHAHMLMTIIAINLNLPVMLLLLDPSQTNFSGWRGAMDQAKLGFEAFQQGYSEQLHTPVYRWKVNQFLQDDPELQRFAVMDGVDIFNHGWYFPAWPYIEPVKDTTANKIKVESFQTNTRSILAEKGIDYDDFIVERIDDNQIAILAAIAAAEEVEKQTGIKVDYHELLNLPSPQNVKVVVNDNASEQPHSSKSSD